MELYIVYVAVYISGCIFTVYCLYMWIYITSIICIWLPVVWTKHVRAVGAAALLIVAVKCKQLGRVRESTAESTRVSDSNLW